MKADGGVADTAAMPAAVIAAIPVMISGASAVAVPFVAAGFMVVVDLAVAAAGADNFRVRHV
jgi:hypothetical protein